jgi:hypothetical protein
MLFVWFFPLEIYSPFDDECIANPLKSLSRQQVPASLAQMRNTICLEQPMGNFGDFLKAHDEHHHGQLHESVSKDLLPGAARKTGQGMLELLL